jgi:gag-polypeptide of LTR copia-type/Zinc knuckle
LYVKKTVQQQPLMDESKVQICRFDGRDFRFWKMQVEALLYQKDLEDALLEKKPENIKSDDEWTKLNRKALSVIQLTLSRDVAYNVASETTVFGVMKALGNTYEMPTTLNKVNLVRRLFKLRMSDGITAAQHLNAFQSITTKLETLNFNLDGEMKAVILLSSLPDSWSTTVDVIGATKEKLSFEEVRDRILNEDIRKQERVETSNAALNMEDRGRRNQRGKGRGRLMSRGRSKSKSRGEFKCWKCGKAGHMKRDCPNLKRDRKGDPSIANTTVEDDNSDDCLMLCVESPIESWILDSGASFHATANKDKFLNFKSGNFGNVHLADGKPLKITGIGDIQIKSSNGFKWVLRKVRYVPELTKNLISVSQLVKKVLFPVRVFPENTVVNYFSIT